MTEWKLMPVDLIDGMDEELPRQILMWYGMSSRPTCLALYEHLQRCGTPIPEWMPDLIVAEDHCPPKAAVLSCLWRAMAERCPERPESLPAGHHVRRPE